ncbi:hypothetical protein EVAR_91121_1 [Eumeta japonica]|uniref:RNase H type-1 domain-containing protein n=1 Tax=Eumeta variegata TaxID=151549 RepID=A0A4C1SDY2_EUMVA|nr:hypothetical protein EVAR_91121_1 [Eumeta japonica]
MVVKPILFYGVTVWWQALDPVSNRLLFERVARTVAILTTGAMRTTPTKALFAILNWLPVDLTARQLAARTALRLCATGMWNPRPWGHASILENAGVRDVIPDLIDYCTPKPFLTRRFITSIWDEAPMDPASIRIYTDGSRVGERVGGGVYIENFNVMMCFRLTDGCSVLQAEISAIRRAAKWLMFYRILGTDILIITDSQAAIKSVWRCHTPIGRVPRWRIGGVEGHGLSGSLRETAG